jgi:DUF438 domain-containing protein
MTDKFQQAQRLATLSQLLTVFQTNQQVTPAQQGLNQLAATQPFDTLALAVLQNSLTATQAQALQLTLPTPGRGEEAPGHPVAVLKLENQWLRLLAVDVLLPAWERWMAQHQTADLEQVQWTLQQLRQVDHHYSRKENFIFPLMYKYSITTPPRNDKMPEGYHYQMDKYGTRTPPEVMWEVDDTIREWLKKANQSAAAKQIETHVLDTQIRRVSGEIDEMVFKEEEIMLMMIRPQVTTADWLMVAQGSAEIGFTLIPQPIAWQPTKQDVQAAAKASHQPTIQEINDVAAVKTPGPHVRISAEDDPTPASTAPQTAKPVTPKPQHYAKAALAPHLEITADKEARVCLPTGELRLDQLEGLLRMLPVDITFVDRHDVVQWFSDNGARVFPRTRAVIGRAVVNCHPPKSMPKVQKILDSFRNGSLDHADFWINLHGEKMVYIRYFAIHDPAGTYLGCLEVTQDITEIQALSDEKRL